MKTRYEKIRKIHRSLKWLAGLGGVGFGITLVILPPPAAESIGELCLLYLLQYLLVFLGPLSAFMTLITHMKMPMMLTWVIVSASSIACLYHAFSKNSSEIWVPVAAGCWITAGTIATFIGLALGV